MLGQFFFRLGYVRFVVTVLASLRSRIRTTFYDLNFPHFSTEMNAKFTKR